MRKGEIRYLLENKRFIEAEIKDKEYQIEELESREYIDVGGVSYEERTKSSNISNSTERQALSIIEKVDVLKREKLQKETQIKRLEKGMELLTDIEKKVLDLKYIQDPKNKFAYINIILKGKHQTSKYIATKAIDKLSKIMQ